MRMLTVDTDTRRFIEEHKTADVRRLALEAHRFPSVDMTFALSQIAGWQTARAKLPSWSVKPSIIYPQHLSMEQCSSEFTAKYKLSVVERLIASGQLKPGSMTDMTGGLGVDFSFLARPFGSAVYVEMQQHLCDIARHNFLELELPDAEVVCGNGEDVLSAMKPQDFIFLDPARRDANGGRTYAMEDCTPNVKALNAMLLQKAYVVMVKLSPMLDWHKAVDELCGVSEVHIVSVNNECKELLLVMTRQPVAADDIRVFCVNNSQTVSYTLGEERSADTVVASPLSEMEDMADGQRRLFLFEPNASLMKAGCFALLCRRYGVSKVGNNSNLFVSSDETADFPGRRFVVEAVFSLNRKETAKALVGVDCANVAVRNFPLSVQELRKRLKLKDGGACYIFATTDSAGQHRLLRCVKAPFPAKTHG